MISVCYDNTSITGCSSIVIVPENAVTEPGYIKAFSTGAESGSKHEFHALAQMACYQYQDDELEVTDIEGDCKITSNDEIEELASGMVIYRSESGELNVAAHKGLNKKKLLEAANRYCTRWVRLDI